MKYLIRVEEEKDYDEVVNLTRESFWNVYKPGCDEHLMVHQIHSSSAFVKKLSSVASDGDKLVASIIYTLAKVVDDQGKSEEVLCMGPICVLPEYRNEGIAAKLIEDTSKKARDLGYKAVVIYGNPDYYRRFGYVNAEKFGITTPDGTNFDAFMALELEEGKLNGVCGKYYVDEAFEIDKDTLSEFEKKFPYKEKPANENKQLQ